MRSLITITAAITFLLGGCSVTFDYGDNEQEYAAVPADAPAETAVVTEPTVPATEAPTENVTEPPSEAELALDKLSLHEKVCQLFIAAPEALSGSEAVTEADEQFAAGYEQYPVGGIIFFARNFISREQTSAMIADMRRISEEHGIPAFMSTDEEGGSLTRIHQQLGAESTYSMSWYGNINDYSAAFDAGKTIGTYLSGYGIDLDFAPVADVNISPYNELGNRIFSTDPAVVSAMSAAVTDGLHSAGVLTTLKHFPGLGAGSGNTHYGSVYIDRTFRDLKEVEFPAFEGGIAAGTDFVMVGHQITSAAGDELPGDLSPTVVTDWLRGELGFRGIAITDSHGMGAIADFYTSGEAAVMALEAGIDMILMPNSLPEAVAGIEEAVNSGRLTEERVNESVLKVLEKKMDIKSSAP